MHVHPPKPLHGWREFLNEILIIVIGILIALGLENIVERWHSGEQTAETIQAIKQELGGEIVSLWEREAVNRCLSDRLSLLSKELSASDTSWKAQPAQSVGYPFQVVSGVYNPPSHSFSDEAWKLAVNSGAYVRIDKTSVAAFTDAYQVAELMVKIETAESQATTQLAPLAYNLTLTPELRVRFIEAIAEADGANTLAAIVAQQGLADIKSLHMNFDLREIERQRKETLAAQRQMRGACVADLPLRL